MKLLRKATRQDVLTTFNWRNDKITRKNSFHTGLRQHKEKMKIKWILPFIKELGEYMKTKIGKWSWLKDCNWKFLVTALPLIILCFLTWALGVRELWRWLCPFLRVAWSWFLSG